MLFINYQRTYVNSKLQDSLEGVISRKIAILKYSMTFSFQYNFITDLQGLTQCGQNRQLQSNTIFKQI